MADPIRTIEYVLIGLMAYQLVRLWWRLNRRRVKKWWQRVKDHHPRHVNVWSFFASHRIKHALIRNHQVVAPQVFALGLRQSCAVDPDRD